MVSVHVASHVHGGVPVEGLSARDGALLGGLSGEDLPQRLGRLLDLDVLDVGGEVGLDLGGRLGDALFEATHESGHLARCDAMRW